MAAEVYILNHSPSILTFRHRRARHIVHSNRLNNPPGLANAAGALTSCTFLNEELLLGHNYIGPCCIAGKDNEPPPFYVKEFDRSMEPVDFLIDAIRKARTSITASLQGNVHPCCSACCYLRRWPSSELQHKEHLFNGLILTHIDSCNLRCLYCYRSNPGYAPQQRSQRYSVAALIKRLLETGLLNPRGRAYWGGGEPTVGEDFEEIVTILSTSGFEQCLNTNAVKLSPAALRALASDAKFSLACSVDAGSRSTYARIKGADAYDTVLRNLKAYAATGGPAYAKYIFLHHNHTEALSFANTALDLGLTHFLIDFDNGSSGEPIRHDHVLFDAAEAYVAHLRARGATISWAGHCRPQLSRERLARVESWFA